MLEERLNNPPSPRGSGERVGVRGNDTPLFTGENQIPMRPLTLTLSPETGGEGISQIGL
jgi:hypothetical protein